MVRSPSGLEWTRFHSRAATDDIRAQCARPSDQTGTIHITLRLANGARLGRYCAPRANEGTVLVDQKQLFFPHLTLRLLGNEQCCKLDKTALATRGFRPNRTDRAW